MNNNNNIAFKIGLAACIFQDYIHSPIQLKV